MKDTRTPGVSLRPDPVIEAYKRDVDTTFRTVDLLTPIQIKRAAGCPRDFEAIAELELLLELRERPE